VDGLVGVEVVTGEDSLGVGLFLLEVLQDLMEGKLIG
jgi:hypothetical protein